MSSLLLLLLGLSLSFLPLLELLEMMMPHGRLEELLTWEQVVVVGLRCDGVQAGYAMLWRCG